MKTSPGDEGAEPATDPDATPAQKEADRTWRSLFGERLRAARGLRSRVEVATLVGLHPNTLGNFERGDRLPDAMQLMKLCREYRISPGELLHLDAGATEALNSEFVTIAGLSVKASAGGGAIVDSEVEVGRFAFRRAWLAKQGLTPATLRVVTAKGDSMEPTVRDGDILLADTSVESVKADGIFLIEHEGELRCKRLQAMIDGGVMIRSDNPRYAAEQLPRGQSELLRVVAQVIWIGGQR